VYLLVYVRKTFLLPTDWIFYILFVPIPPCYVDY
jgi:hypothetical protein